VGGALVLFQNLAQIFLSGLDMHLPVFVDIELGVEIFVLGLKILDFDLQGLFDMGQFIELGQKFLFTVVD